MTTEHFIIELFCRVDDMMPDAQKHAQANLHPSEVVTIALLFALKGVGNRAFYRWLKRDYLPLFPQLPERTRLFRLFNSHGHWTERFMANPSLMGLIDTFGIELIHPRHRTSTTSSLSAMSKAASCSPVIAPRLSGPTFLGTLSWRAPAWIVFFIGRR